MLYKNTPDVTKNLTACLKLICGVRKMSKIRAQWVTCSPKNQSPPAATWVGSYSSSDRESCDESGGCIEEHKYSRHEAKMSNA